MTLSARLTRILILSLILWPSGSRGQGFHPPQGYRLKKASDYRPYENTVRQALAWILTCNPETDQDDLLQTEKFLLDWTQGAPELTLTIGKVIHPLLHEKKSPPWQKDVFMAYMGGMAVYELDHTGLRSEDSVQMAGLNSMLTFYANNLELMSGDKVLRNYFKLSQEGKLEAWVHKRVK